MNHCKENSIFSRNKNVRRRSSVSVTRSSFTTLDHIRSAWNQLKFGWSVQLWPNFDRNSIIYMLGRCYFDTSPDNHLNAPKDIVWGGNFSDFTEDFASRLWFTYRDSFPPLLKNSSNNHNAYAANLPNSLSSIFIRRPSSCYCEATQTDADPLKAKTTVKSKDHHFVPLSTYGVESTSIKTSNSFIPLSVQTSDCGWGCMFRCGQMLLAQALVVHFLGRDWRLMKGKSTNISGGSDFNRQIIKWFNDSWSPSSPLSLHRLVHVSGKKPGEWCGPASVCTAILHVMAQGSSLDNRLGQIEVYLARDRVIYRQEIMDIARGSYTKDKIRTKLHFTDHTANYRSQVNQTNDSENTGSSAILLLIPLMFGKENCINPCYIQVILSLFSDPTFVGLIGGRRKHSSYYVGCQNDSLIYLDPHFTQPTQRLDSLKFPIDSWYCPIPKTMNAAKLDPCCAVGFYCRTRGELSDLIDRLPVLLSINKCAEETSKSSTVKRIVEVLSLEEMESV
ncbi:unnamed protein product [Trichobilharzia szidati]|nr:unnamed protein product [Trichobilharzia szidati]